MKATEVAGLIGTLNFVPVADLVEGARAWMLSESATAPTDGCSATVALGLLQDEPDYRAVLRHWFAPLRIGGRLIVSVPHAFLFDRQIMLSLRRRAQQKRLYTPASLMQEIEEALQPNSYRVRWLGDRDGGYDYSLDEASAPVGDHEVVAVIERIEPPAWSIAAAGEDGASGPGVEFAPPRTQVEAVGPVAASHILVLKLDHLGDFIMGIPALERLRTCFPHAHITLVVGSWNEAVARDLGVADTVLCLDVFPRNSADEEVDVGGKTALFARTVQGRFDIAIDLRTDEDTRFLLRHVDAAVLAGMGAKVEFPYLDIFLPVDGTRHEPETAYVKELRHDNFALQPFCTRGAFHSHGEARHIRADMGALIWGPYWPLRRGRYLFEPYLEVDAEQAGALRCDIAIEEKSVVFRDVTRNAPIRLAFDVTQPGSRFEFRVSALEDVPPLGFRFFGGKLIREGAASVLHQSEYLALLVELIAIRAGERGTLQTSGVQA